MGPALERAVVLGLVAPPPVGGLEPVHMVSELSPQMARTFALKLGEVRSLGWRWPRRWISK